MSETESLMPKLNETLEKINPDSTIKYPVQIRVSIEFLSIGEVDTLNEKFQAEVRIISKWCDEQADKTEFKSEEDWNPYLFIENSLHDVKEEIKYKIDKIDDYRREITETRIAKGNFWERIELQNFPLDTQELSITLASKRKTTQVNLIQNQERISTIYYETLHSFRDQQKWKLYKMVKVSQQASYDIGSARSINNIDVEAHDFHEMDKVRRSKRAKFVATCYCSRRPAYYLINCFSFNFLITVLSLTIFSIETRLAPNRISGTFTLILTSVSFKWVSNRTLPTVSYLTSLDKYQITSIIYLVLCCVWHSTIASIAVEMPTKIIIDKIVVGIFATIFITIQIVFSIRIFSAFRGLKQLKLKEERFIRQVPEYDDDEF
ncbi:unnamed protein product [Brachionus calyciflorus]|uniref:Neurotransmitter-gated ion-channel ligand-binding domain-containing protein n=1 Tax=Brachionus calyciflorus TaxID=104777 RepID=A0A814CNK8_9BILA|nr:unnamed protein product [Brachionus calyciflorus]